MLRSSVADEATTTNAKDDAAITMRHWFTQGRRVHFDPLRKQIVHPKTAETIDVFELVRYPKQVRLQHHTRWITLLPGFPDGSFGYAKTDNLLSNNTTTSSLPRLYVEYVGQGDSDKPSKYDYSTMERADLVQALWKLHGIHETVIVTFDYSSLVLLELLQRQREGKMTTKIQHCLLLNGGLFADGHTHPFTTTPLLKTRFGAMGAGMAQRSNLVFDVMLKPLYGKEYRATKLTKQELRETQEAIRLHKGTKFLSKAAGFVDEHKKNDNRWNLEKIYVDYAQYEGITFHLVGSAEDPFEHRQIDLAKLRLQSYYPSVVIERIPGGHLSTSEQPERIVRMIELMVRKPHPLPVPNGHAAKHIDGIKNESGFPGWTTL